MGHPAALDVPDRRRLGRPPNHVVRHYTSFHYRTKSWVKSRRVVAKIECHSGELFPRVGFIVTNRGIDEQHIKEGKYALKWALLLSVRMIQTVG